MQPQQPNQWDSNQQWDPNRQSTPPPNNWSYGYGAPPPKRSNWFADFITFRWMITPSIIMVVYALGFLGISLAALVIATTPTYYGSSASNLIGAIVLWIFGQIYLRVILEVLIVLFRLYESVRNIDRKTREQ